MSASQYDHLTRIANQQTDDNEPPPDEPDPLTDPTTARARINQLRQQLHKETTK